ncbi:DUF938 domain-containing protein [Methyloprofundus sp.]|uniref:DUF938 domain-containing protein n=1 Tax=Methyloprofundus sp. TaxID=2020875 RepID=UPI003D0F079A
MNKPFSQSSENNKQPILQVIETIFRKPATVWEIGSGTGQHACYFAQKLPHLQWQATDREENLPGINRWIEDAKLDNLATSLALNVSDTQWPCQQIEAIFTANTLHIMHWHEVEAFFSGLAKYLSARASVCIYGPFNYQRSYTSTSNEQFDKWLKARDPESGIRDFSEIEQLANAAGVTIQDDHAMPANNRLLVLLKN